MKNINERYTHKELRSIYKDAKYNWYNNCEPMYLATDEENNDDGIYIIKIDGDVKICCHSKGKLRYDDVNIISFDSMLRLYIAILDLLRKEVI